MNQAINLCLEFMAPILAVPSNWDKQLAVGLTTINTSLSQVATSSTATMASTSKREGLIKRQESLDSLLQGTLA